MLSTKLWPFALGINVLRHRNPYQLFTQATYVIVLSCCKGISGSNVPTYTEP